MTDTRTFFFPTTAECQSNLGYPGPSGTPSAPGVPNNTMGGYGGLLDLNDYNGNTGNPSILIKPDDVGTSAGIRDLMPAYLAFARVAQCWYLMRRVDFKDWSGITGIFWRPTSFIMEIDILPAVMPANGGYRDEDPNHSLQPIGSGPSNTLTPYGAGAQGSGINFKAIITDQITHLEVVKDSKTFQGANGQNLSPVPLAFPRQTVQLNLANITPAEMASMVLRVTTEQYSSQYTAPTVQAHSPQDSTIYRIGLTPDPASLRSAGKLSATMTSR